MWQTTPSTQARGTHAQAFWDIQFGLRAQQTAFDLTLQWCLNSEYSALIALGWGFPG